MSDDGIIRIVQLGYTIYRIHDDNDSRISSINKKTIDKMLSTTSKYLEGLLQVKVKVEKNMYATFFTDSLLFSTRLTYDIMTLNVNLSNFRELFALFKKFTNLGFKNENKHFIAIKHFIYFIPQRGIIISSFSIFNRTLARFIYLKMIKD